MKRVVIILTVSLISFGLGYWIGQLKTFADGVVNDIGKYELKTDSTGQLIRKENFDDFIYKFISDSLYQLDRIKFPLKYYVLNEEDGITTTFINKTDWRIDRIFGNDSYKTQIYNNFQKELQDTEIRLIWLQGLETGINVEYKFERINGLWYLIEYIDKST